jgi:quercetin dioxygenase-like cupin family protein
LKEQILKSSGKWLGPALAALFTLSVAVAAHIGSSKVITDAFSNGVVTPATHEAAWPLPGTQASGARTSGFRPWVNAKAVSRASATQPRMAFSHGLPPLDGAHLSVKVVEVTYEPGEASLPHSYPCPVIGYVLEGAVRMQVQGEPEAIFKAGESFYEAPNGVHAVSANAIKEVRARFLAYFVCDHDTPLTVAPPKAKAAGDK